MASKRAREAAAAAALGAMGSLSAACDAGTTAPPADVLESTTEMRDGTRTIFTPSHSASSYDSSMPLSLPSRESSPLFQRQRTPSSSIVLHDSFMDDFINLSASEFALATEDTDLPAEAISLGVQLARDPAVQGAMLAKLQRMGLPLQSLLDSVESAASMNLIAAEADSSAQHINESNEELGFSEYDRCEDLLEETHSAESEDVNDAEQDVKQPPDASAAATAATAARECASLLEGLGVGGEEHAKRQLMHCVEGQFAKLNESLEQVRREAHENSDSDSDIDIEAATADRANSENISPDENLNSEKKPTVVRQVAGDESAKKAMHPAVAAADVDTKGTKKAATGNAKTSVKGDSTSSSEPPQKPGRFRAGTILKVAAVVAAVVVIGAVCCYFGFNPFRSRRAAAAAARAARTAFS